MRKILIVDDDRVILNLLAEGLRDLGYHADTAVSGQEALRRAREAEFDLAVLDMRMPGMTGVEVARALREERLVPFVFLSAFGDEAVVKEAAEAGALGYLVKPVDVPHLVPFIEAAIIRGREIDHLRGTAERLDLALKVEQKTRTAVGILMERRRVDRQEAFDLLRARARSQRRKIGDVADELIGALEALNLSPREP